MRALRTGYLRFLVLALGMAILLYGLALFALIVRLPHDGYSVHFSREGVVVDQANLIGPLRVGDVITNIADHPVHADLMKPGEWYRRLFAKAERLLTYQVRRDAETLLLTVDLARPISGALLAHVGVLYVIGLTFVLSGLLVAFHRGGGKGDRAGRLIAVTFLLEGLNLFTNTTNAAGANLAVAFFWITVPLDVISFWLVLSFFLHSFLVFPEEVSWIRRRSWVVPTIHLVNPVVAGLGSWLLGGGEVLPTRAILFRLSYPIGGLMLLMGVGRLIYLYRTTHRPLVRTQIRWLVWGLVVGTLPWLLFFNLPIILSGEPLLPLGLTLVPLIAIPITFTFAVTRYRLLSIDRLINRSLVYGALSLVLVVFYFATVALFSRMVQIAAAGVEDTTIVFFSTLLVALLFLPARQRIQAAIDRTFYRHKITFQQVPAQVGRELSTTLVFDQLTTLLTERLPRQLEIAGAVLYILDEEASRFTPHGSLTGEPIPAQAPFLTPLRGGNKPLVWTGEEGKDGLWTVAPSVALWLPLVGRGGLIGLYGLGVKESGDLYTDEEIESLRLLSHQIAIAVENARLYRQVEAYSKGLEAQVQERTQALEAANQALCQEKSKLDAVIHNIADGLVVTDSAGHILLTNPVFQRMVGQPATWLRGQSLADLPFDEGLVMVVAQALEEVGQVFTTDVQAAKRIYRASATALQTDGRATGVVTVLRDVTHEVEVDRMKTDFISTVSHELRTPLTSVLGFARLIRKAFEREIVPVLPEVRQVQRAKKRILDNLTIIESESQRLTRLINDVLDIAKMEAGRMEWHMEETDLGEVIRQAIAATTALAGEKGLPIQVDLPAEGLPPIWGDRDRLIQVMTNLLSNAIKFTERGRIEVRGEVIPAEAVATLRSGDAPLPPGEWVAVHVTDTGVGIRAEDLPHVFEKFRQVGNALTNRPRGTGLGLSICKEIVEHHGGRIWVESQVGVGSTFSFALPLTGTGAVPESPAEPKLTPLVEIRRRVEAQLPLPPSGTKTILVADDEANIRELLRQELAEAGYRVIEAADGPEALEKARRERPDLIILDVMMPGVSGFDVTSVLKADEQTQEIPILILSIIEDRERGLRLGADAYLTKPVEVDALLTTIARLLAKDQGPIRRKVLVIDRDQSAVEAITRTLRERGYEVVEAYDPRGAILKARREKPDLVILDAMISQMNDYEVLKALRYQDREGRTCIIVLAGEVSPQQEAEARRQGADDVARREDLPDLLDEGR